MKQKLQLIAAMTAALLALAACGKSTSQEMTCRIRNGTATYNGTEIRTVLVPDGEAREVRVSVSRQNGRLSVCILQTQSGTYAYRGEDLPTSDFTVLLKEPGTYRVEITAERFQGGYEVTDSAQAA